MLFGSKNFSQVSKHFTQGLLSLSTLPPWATQRCLYSTAPAGPIIANEVVVVEPTVNNGSPPITAVVIHGLLGAGKNWRSFTTKLAEQAAAESSRSWRMVLVDQRNHGASTSMHGLHPPHSLQSSAADVIRLMDRQFGGVPQVVIGHSLGGKVALELLMQLSDRGGEVPKQVWILDAQPNALPRNTDSDVDKVIREIEQIPLPVPTRKWLYDYMQQRGYSLGLAQWLGSNLAPDDRGNLRWAFNISGAAAMYHSYKVHSYWDLLGKPPDGTTIHLVRAALSDRWDPDTLTRLDELAAAQTSKEHGVGHLALHVLPKAGHWLHTDNPIGLQQLMVPLLADVAHTGCQ